MTRPHTLGRSLHRLLVSAVLLLALTLSVAGCKSSGGSKVENDPILQLSADESLERGRELMEAGKYRQATDYLSHAFEVAPNSASGRSAGATRCRVP